MSLTTISEIPPGVVKWGMCLLIHKKTPVWDGDYRWDDLTQKNIPNIKYICKECEKTKASQKN